MIDTYVIDGAEVDGGDVERFGLCDIDHLAASS